MLVEDLRKNLASYGRLFVVLTPLEKKVLLERYGFMDRPQTLQEVGNGMKITRERVRQIEDKALHKLETASRYREDNNLE